MSTFKNKWIWITGASAGLGAAMARAFALENANLILSARNVEKLQAVADACEGTGEKHILPLDLTEIDLLDRKSTRLNSSHVAISYAVFCLKNKKYTPNYNL